MVGQSGLNAVERVVMGSVSSYIIRQAPCDVLIVHSEKISKRECQERKLFLDILFLFAILRRIKTY